MNMKRVQIVATIMTLAALSAVLFKINESHKKLDDLLDHSNAYDLINYSMSGEMADVDAIAVTTINEDGIYATGNSLNDILSDYDVECLKLNNDYYTSDGRSVYVYDINGQYLVLNPEEYDCYNGSVRFVDTKPYEELKDYDLYFDVDENNPYIDQDNSHYYRVNKSLVKHK